MKTRLRHVAKVNPLSRRFERIADDELVTFLPMENVWPGDRLDLSQSRLKSAVATGYTRFESGDVVVPKITPTFEASRSVLIPGIPHSVGAGTTELHVVRPGPDIDPHYLLYLFHAHDFLKLGAAEMYGVAGQKRVPDELIRDWTVDLPPIDQQRRIADFLDVETARTSRLISAQQSAIQLIGERRKRVLEDILIGRDDLTSWSPLGYLTEYNRPIMYGIVLPGPNVEDGVPIVKGGDVAAGRLSLAQLNKTTYEIEASYTRSRLRAGDLVIAIRGSVGEVASVPDEIAGSNLTQDAARIAPRPDVHPRWLELVLQTPTVQNQIGSRITGATIKGINIWDLRRILLPQGSLDKQSRAAKAADVVLASMDAFTDAANRQLALLAERRQALITAAVTGGISV
jgi:type I restriction enzyme, S subunit